MHGRWRHFRKPKVSGIIWFWWKLWAWVVLGGTSWSEGLMGKEYMFLKSNVFFQPSVFGTGGMGPGLFGKYLWNLLFCLCDPSIKRSQITKASSNQEPLLSLLVTSRVNQERHKCQISFSNTEVTQATTLTTAYRPWLSLPKAFDWKRGRDQEGTFLGWNIPVCAAISAARGIWLTAGKESNSR